MRVRGEQRHYQLLAVKLKNKKMRNEELSLVAQNTNSKLYSLLTPINILYITLNLSRDAVFIMKRTQLTS